MDEPGYFIGHRENCSQVMVRMEGGEVWLEINPPSEDEEGSGTWMLISEARQLRDWLNDNLPPTKA
jgi:hypothetical protein